MGVSRPSSRRVRAPVSHVRWSRRTTTSTSAPASRASAAPLQGALTAADDEEPAPAEHAEVTVLGGVGREPGRELGELGRAACEGTYTGGDDDAVRRDLLTVGETE